MTAADDGFRGPPEVAPTAFVHPLASVCGTVRLAAGVSVWGGAILRGDTEQIAVGEGSNIQDLTMVHADPGKPTSVGARVTVGHRAILHGCTIDDDVLIGMGAILLNGCRNWLRLRKKARVRCGSGMPPDG